MSKKINLDDFLKAREREVILRNEEIKDNIAKSLRKDEELGRKLSESENAKSDLEEQLTEAGIETQKCAFLYNSYALLTRKIGFSSPDQLVQLTAWLEDSNHTVNDFRKSQPYADIQFQFSDQQGFYNFVQTLTISQKEAKSLEKTFELEEMSESTIDFLRSRVTLSDNEIFQEFASCVNQNSDLAYGQTSIFAVLVMPHILKAYNSSLSSNDEGSEYQSDDHGNGSDDNDLDAGFSNINEGS